jgi:16S rRNA (guanine527-N7)-methyltransferase
MTGTAGTADSALAAVLVEARDLGFLGPGSIERHIEHARGFATAVAEAGVTGDPGEVLDLGSGGGLPGLVLAALWPTSHLTLLDAGTRRAEFLRRAVDACGLEGRVRVLHCRAEEAGRVPAERGAYDVVVARSFGPPAVTAECAAPFLAVGGLLVTSEPPAPDAGLETGAGDGPGQGVAGPAAPAGDAASAGGSGHEAPPGEGEGRWPAEGLALLGMVVWGAVRREFGYQVICQETAVADRFPRRVGVPAKRPLF